MNWQSGGTCLFENEVVFLARVHEDRRGHTPIRDEQVDHVNDLEGQMENVKLFQQGYFIRYQELEHGKPSTPQLSPVVRNLRSGLLLEAQNSMDYA